jgi:hypothetical protein
MPAEPTFPSVVALVLERLTGELSKTGLVEGLYLYGSLTTGDYSLARSDIDLVAVTVPAGLGHADLVRLRAVHEDVAGAGGPAARLNCLYVRGGTLGDAEQLHPYWYGDRFTQWQLKKMTVAELRHAGRPLHGSWPPPGLGVASVEELRAAVRAELAGYWRDMACTADIWREDAWVDFGLITLPRAAALLRDGELITKSQAIGRLGDFGVPADLADEIRRRRAGEDVCPGAAARRARAELAQRIMLDGIRALAGEA